LPFLWHTPSLLLFLASLPHTPNPGPPSLLVSASTERDDDDDDDDDGDGDGDGDVMVVAAVVAVIGASRSRSRSRSARRSGEPGREQNGEMPSHGSVVVLELVVRLLSPLNENPPKSSQSYMPPPLLLQSLQSLQLLQLLQLSRW
jgi:hypothetical protein